MTVVEEIGSGLCSPCFAYGPPPASGRIRSRPEDFQVEEVLGFEPSGQGCHALVQIRKREANTEWVAQQLARCAGVPRREVGYAGLKDRHAVTVQWFSVNLQGRTEPEWDTLNASALQILRVVPHSRKLRVGAHRANRFRLHVRDLDGDLAGLDARLSQIGAGGVPNVFGGQRFGHGGANVGRARAMLRGELRVRNRKLRGIYLSALRSELFNRVLFARIGHGSWNAALEGEALVLDGSRSYFCAEHLDPDLQRRVALGDVHPSGPLCGRGEPPVQGPARQLETHLLAAERELVEALGRLGLQHERRSLRLPVHGLCWELDGDRSLELGFELPSGAYATAVLRELLKETPGV